MEITKSEHHDYSVQWSDSDFEAVLDNEHGYKLYTEVFDEVVRHMANIKYKTDVVMPDGRVIAKAGQYHLSDDQTDYNRCILELALAVNDALIDGPQFITEWANNWLTFVFEDDLDALNEAANNPLDMIQFLVNQRSQ